MAHLVRTKASILSFSVIGLILIVSLRASFYRTPIIKRWDAEEQLTWEDFKGIPIPFSKYGATINSQVYMEYDSLTEIFYAYAGQNNMLSWSKVNGEYGLKHEQYHFNVTELHARKLNNYFSQAKNVTLEEAEKKLSETNIKLGYFQKRFDRETEHSQKEAQQSYWEFKIDSSLQEYTHGKGILIDNLAELSAKFPKQARFVSGVNKQKVTYRGYSMSGYWMDFVILSYQYTEVSEDDLVKYYAESFQEDTTKVMESSLGSGGFYSYYDVNKVNKALTHEIWDRIYSYGDKTYFTRVVAPYDSVDRGYEQIKDSIKKHTVF